MRTITQLDESTLIHLSSNRYYLNIIHKVRANYRISCEEKIGFYAELLSLKKEFMQKNTVVAHHYVILVDVNFNWSIYCVKSIEEDPKMVFCGKLMSQKQEFKRLVNVHQINGKIVFLFEQFQLLYVDLSTRNQQNGKYLLCRQFVPYGKEPEFEHHKFALRNGYLPVGQDSLMILSYYQQLNAERSVLYLIYRSLHNNMYSIYTLDFNRANAYFLSGKSVLYNIQSDIVALWSTSVDSCLIVQTEDKLILWNIGQKGGQSLIETYNIKIKSSLVRNMKGGESILTGISFDNKILTISFDKGTKKLKKEIVSLANLPQNVPLLQVYLNTKSEQYYLLTNKEQLLFFSRKQSQKIISNEETRIQKSHLSINNNFNFLIISKTRGKEQERILYGNHLFTYEVQHFNHGVMLASSQIVKVENTIQNIGIYVTSPLIGLSKLVVSMKSDKSDKKSTSKIPISTQGLSNFGYDFSLDKNLKLSIEQTLFLNDKFQVTSEQITQVSKKSVKINKMFENAAEYISKALILANDLILLVVNEQIHVFDSKFIRKYIYCFNSEIKNIFSLNNFNVVAVELYLASLSNEAGGNELTILILQQQKASKLKTIVVPQLFNFIQLSTVINTAQYKLNLFGNRLIICSNDALHRYQIEKITVEEFWLPLPVSNLNNFSIIPLQAFAKQRNNTDFVLIFREEAIDLDKQFDEVQLYLCSFNVKYLLKKIDLKEITVNYERVLTLSELPRDKIMMVVSYNYSEGTNKTANIFKHLMMVGQRSISLCAMKFGRIELEWLQNRVYLQNQLKKIESFSQSIINLSASLTIAKPIFFIPTFKKEFILIRNSRQIYYASHSSGKIELISYYSLMNDDFVSFRNNLNINEMNDDQFMHVFNQKLVIKDIKYVNDRTIFVLYDICLIILEIGYNNSLVVRQEIKFRFNDTADIIKIDQFLQNYDEDSIYLRESHGRIYLLKKVQDSYEIIFHSYMDEEVLLFSRVHNWNKRDRTYPLVDELTTKKQYEELILKKDGQLIVKSMESKNQDNNKFVYL